MSYSLWSDDEDFDATEICGLLSYGPSDGEIEIWFGLSQYHDELDDALNHGDAVILSLPIGVFC